MATNFSPCKGSYVLNQFPSNVMFGMNGFHVSAGGAIQGHHGPLVFLGLNPLPALCFLSWIGSNSNVNISISPHTSDIFFYCKEFINTVLSLKDRLCMGVRPVCICVYQQGLQHTFFLSTET